MDSRMNDVTLEDDATLADLLLAPPYFDVIYLSPNDRSLIRKASDASVLLIPAVGPKISNVYRFFHFNLLI